MKSPITSTKTKAQAFDLLAKAHDAFVFQTRDLYTARIRDLLKFHLSEIPCGSYVLDMGGGTGQWSLDLAHLGYKVILTDISSQMLWYAKTHLATVEQIQLVCADAANPPFQPNMFRVIMLVGDVLSYLDQPVEVLRTLARTGGSNTLFIGTVISRIGFAIKLIHAHDSASAQRLLLSGYAIERTESDLSYLAVKQGLPKPNAPLAFHGYTVRELREVITASGLKPITIAGLNIFKTLGLISTTNTTTDSTMFRCEQWLSTRKLWSNLSTNLFFAAML